MESNQIQHSQRADAPSRASPAGSRVMKVQWCEPACLVQYQRGDLPKLIVDGSFADAASALARLPIADRKDVCIAFPERKIPPFYFNKEDFPREVFAWLFALGLNRNGARGPGQRRLAQT